MTILDPTKILVMKFSTHDLESIGPILYTYLKLNNFKIDRSIETTQPISLYIKFYYLFTPIKLYAYYSL